jgi:hypothetical protein
MFVRNYYQTTWRYIYFHSEERSLACCVLTALLRACGDWPGQSGLIICADSLQWIAVAFREIRYRNKQSPC